MNARSKITSKGQTTVPAEVREALGLKPGDQVDYVIEDGTVELRKVPSALDLAGILYDPNRKPLTIEDMNKAVEEAILERYERSFDRD
ncbi:MAG: type II toxin-antitoxin system PrlF family antitoxin [Pseudomonadota bacterium]